MLRKGIFHPHEYLAGLKSYELSKQNLNKMNYHIKGIYFSIMYSTVPRLIIY